MPAVCGQFLDLERTGNKHRALCPFHKETKPSFVVYENGAYCFGCNKAWGPISFLMEYNNWNYLQAKRWLEKNQFVVIDTPKKRRNHTITPIPRMIIDHWHQMALDSSDVIRYYQEKRLLTEETIRMYRLGWDGKRYVIPLWEGYPGESVIINAKKRKANEDDPGPKYMAMPHRPPVLFNRWCLKEAKEAFFFFGEFDALLAWQDGLAAVTGGGTNNWSEAWLPYFSEIDYIHFVPDRGETKYGYRLASKFLGRSDVIFYPDGVHDYTDFRQLGYRVGDFLNLIQGK